MFADFSAAAMELGEVLGLQGLAVPSTKESDMSLIKRAGSFTQAAAAAASYPSPFLDEQKMLRFAKAAHTLPSGLDFGRENEQRFLLSRTKRPFTPSQWMELEHQALIYKYLNAKAPIPSSLLISISKSFRSSANRMSWRPLYQGFPNADSDPEPGRCRRTDGKKWRCSKEAMADHKYCERHINRNRHRSRKPVENQSRKTVKETPCAGSLPSSVGQGSFKKAKVNEMKPGSVSYWTDSLNRTMVGKEKGSKAAEENNAPLLNLTSQQPTLSLLSQLKQQNKGEKFSPTVDSESVSSNTILKPWESSNQQSSKNISFTKMHDRGCLQSVLQSFSLPKDEKMEFQKSKDSSAMPIPTFYSSPEGPRVSCHTSNMAQMQEDSISSSWEMPQGGPLGEILTNSKNIDDLAMKPEARPYGWLLNLEDHAM
ncbi:growth-regulating factor 9 [Oryza brachyantha]|uniref:Growth-regulating factor n=1 Tax=Oryza brachyantha TaxID=4533 RepID=J3LRI9_ORYBR|nr:growth-regulating factor 9 [Oryza brachyantha]